MKRIWKFSLVLCMGILTLVGCNSNNNSNEINNSVSETKTTTQASETTEVESSVSSTTKLDYSNTFTPIGSDIIDVNQWYIQYPSGTDEGGMLLSDLSADFANKYFSRENDYLKFSLNAQDKGKSPNGSSVRSELHSIGTTYYFSGNDEISNINHSGNSAEFKYTFKINSTQLDIAKFTVGQFEMYSGYDYVDNKRVPDKPLIMISVVMGELIAYIKYYNRSYVDGHYEQLGDTNKISLGTVENMKDISIRIVLNDRKIDIYRDGVHKVDLSFKDNQDSMYGVYFKLGIYYQTKQDDERIEYLFTDVYVKDVSLIVN
ncbi:MAG: polysaccharide lyase family 7 protein [Acholeplasmatales bacterium]|nr:polysaccharide lyase family 7 protein [Acholeplasmatales bacterium]